MATAAASPAIKISIGLPSLCSIAFTSRLRTIRSIRRASTSARASPPPSTRTLISVPYTSASRPCDSSTRSTISRRSTRSVLSTAAPASNREISSRSVSSASNRSSSACISSADLAETGSKSSRASCRTSAAIRTVVSGVRSSCETSETNRCWTADRSSKVLICFSSSEAM